MKTGREIKDVAEELKRQLNTKHDYVATTVVLSVNDDASELQGINNESLPLTDHCHSQIASYLSIPKKYYDTMRTTNPYLLAMNINRWFSHADFQKKKRLIRTLDGSARAFLSNRYRAIDNWDIANTVLPIANSVSAQIESCELTQSYMHLKFVVPGVTAKIDAKVGDVVSAGLVVRNSEIGCGSVAVEPMIYTLACKNGMIVPAYGQKRRHVGRYIDQIDADEAVDLFSDTTLKADNRALFLKISDVVRNVFKQDVFSRIVGDLQETAQNGIERPVKGVIEDVTKQYNFTEPESDGVLNHLIAGGDLTQYGLINAITRASQDVADYDRATELERIGGQVFELGHSEWQKLAVDA